MKIIKIVFVTFLVIVLILGAGLFIFVKTFNIENYKPQIVASATKALGKDVKINKLVFALSLQQGVSLIAKGVTLSASGAKPFDYEFDGQELNLGVNLNDLWRERKIVIAEAKINNAQVTLDYEDSDKTFHIPLKQLNLAIKDFSLTETIPFKVTAALGSEVSNITLQGSLKLDQSDGVIKSANAQAQVDARRIPLPILLNGLHLPVELEGVLDGKWDITGKGITPEEIQSSLVGQGTLSLHDGEIKNVNLLRMIVDQLAGMQSPTGESPLVNLDKNISEHYKEKLNEKDTIITKGEFLGHMEQGKLYFDNIEFETDELRVEAKGRMGLAGDSIDLEASVHLSKDFSSVLVGSIAEFSAFVDQKGEIFIPFRPYHGSLKGIKMYPDLKYLGKKFFMGTGQEELKRVIFKALKLGDGKTDASNSTDQPSGNEDSSKQTKEKEAIEGILNSIFH